MYIACLSYSNRFLLSLYFKLVNLLYIHSCFRTLFSHCTAGHCEFLLRGINKGLSYLILSYHLPQKYYHEESLISIQFLTVHVSYSDVGLQRACGLLKVNTKKII